MRRQRAREAAGSRAAAGRSALRQCARTSRRRVDRRSGVHRLHEMHSGVSGRCDRRRVAFMHTVIAAQCTGCELCIPPCPVDCIVMRPAPASSADRMATVADCAAACDSMLTRSARPQHALRPASLGRNARPAARSACRRAAVPLVKPGRACSARTTDRASPAARSAPGCIRRCRELSRRSSRGPRRIASALPRSASSSRTTAATSVMRQLRRRRSNSSPPEQLREHIAPRRHRRARRRGISHGREAEQRRRSKRTATAAQRRRVRALHQLRRHADARTRRATSCSARAFCCTRSAAPTCIDRHRRRHAAGGRSARALRSPMRTTSESELRRVPSIYPAGGEKQLITAIFGVEVPSRRSARGHRHRVPERRHGSCRRALGSRRRSR